jgi:MtfA peptidase
MWRYRSWRRRRIMARSSIADHDWRRTCAGWPPLARLSSPDRARLRELVVLFLHEKVFESAQGLILTDTMRLTIATQACLPILNLGLGWYKGWTAIVVYPGGFVPTHTYEDGAGVVHTSREPICGESWQQGPVVLSWSDLEAAALGYNLVIHELAHKLDMLNGTANGMPPLHRGMDARAWTRDFSQAYEDLEGRLSRGEEVPIDPYAAEDPAEFFAVFSELFFEAPAVVIQHYPAVYRQLCDFYRQQPGTTA